MKANNKEKKRNDANEVNGKKINLQEYVSKDCELTPDQLEALLRVSKTLHLSIEPVQGAKGKYRLKPGSTVGAVEIEDVSVLIEPKIEMSQLLSLACYAIGKLKFQKESFDFKDAETLPDVLALALVAAARRAFGRGLLRGYLSVEDSLFTVRGRIRFDEQVRRRYGTPLPVELRFDEFTEDILANRLVKVAAARLGDMILRSPEARRGLGWIAANLENVSLLDFRQRRVPVVRFDQLNDHYRQVVGLARLILLHSEFESFRGEVRASGFLVDMNKLFQEFITQALREALKDTPGKLHAENGGFKITLDKEDKVQLFPDLSWWEDGTCTFVGDAKYKDLSGKRAENSDLYQLLAYSTALKLPGGLLIYAQGNAKVEKYTVDYADKVLEVTALDLSGSLEEIRTRVETVADHIQSMRKKALEQRQPPEKTH